MSTTCEIEFINESIETLKFPLENDSTTDLIPEIYYRLQKKDIIDTGDKHRGGERSNLPKDLNGLVELAKIKSIKVSTALHGKVTERYLYPI
ncbi:Uncharacterised protein [Yersinia enterocolitica]|uniref:hypothetical protein n=1 Tax=Yersinia enterocolitica TaxID=630 RepID=UPI0005E4D288|nr:hypothetical protein [Yersinia enterocolitica]ELI8283382.1 hypothetical protein [Yersinia enterocolitica]MCE3129229.1 hypothetical protein [Yersinia enterocolitica]RLY99471.1 hypothetical protein COO51_13330 [Yersinia enterocolitica]CFQ14970.1 Uncharacterised protein [Yersinia enterocolitica]CNF47471.1 Uncharacterised protein [Yersinia enterocolitica]